MSGNRANIIKTTGLETFGSEISRPEGSLKKGLNVNIDEDAVITPRRGFNDYGLPTSGIESSILLTSQIMEYKNAIIRQYTDKLEYEDTSKVFQSITGTFAQLREGYRTKWQEASSNLYFTTSEGIKKISVKNHAGFNANMVRDAGGLKAGYASGITVPTVGGFLPPQSKVAYRVLLGYKDASNNLIYGTPSSRFVITNFAETVESYETSSFIFDTNTGTDEITNGDHIIYTNGTGKYTFYFDTNGSATEPYTALTIGSTFIKIATGGVIDVDSTLAAIAANTIANNLPNTTVTLDGTDTVVLTSTEIGDIIGISSDAYDASGSVITASTTLRLDTATVSEGATATGASANVNITGVIPSEATTEYFYQVYRTANISTAVGLDLSDLDPGDEANLVYESGLTSAEITAGEFTFVDTTPDSFRAEGAPLYTNQVTGEGINQANEVPPIALDIELFRNYMFYGNTKQKHKLEFTIVSVDDFISESTRFIIGNDEITRYYTFVGTAQVQDLDIDSTPTAGDYVEFTSANDERSYYIYFGNTGDDPSIAGSIGYRVSLDGTPSTSDLASRVETAVIDNVDVSVSAVSNTATFTWQNNGYTSGLTNGVGSSVTIQTASTTGTGELKYNASTKPEGGDVLLSGLVSVGQSIDETARSLVKIISQDTLSPVNAYYLSSGEDLPGNILLEARSLEDRTFYIAIEESSNILIGEEFTPELPYSKEIAQFDETSGDATKTTITLTSHGYSNGDEVFIGYYEDPNTPSDPDSFSGIYTISGVTANTFDIEVANVGVAAFIPAFSAIFSAEVESDNEELANRVYYSKFSEPEAVPTENYFDVGARDAEILRVIALRDELYVLKEDGIFVVSGTSAPDWSVRLVDSTRILAPDSAVVLNNQIYCLTDQGVVRISGSSAAVISRGIENKIDSFINAGFEFAANTFGIAYENDRAYIMFCPVDSTDTSATQAYRYNIFERTWTRWEYEATCGHVLSRNNKLYVGNGDRNYISQERKNNNRTDHSDRNFEASINNNGVSGTSIELSSIVNVAVGDVIVQEQEVSVYWINWEILKRMDAFDTGVVPPSGSTMYDSFKATTGDNLASVMQALNDYLRTLDAVYITAKSFTLSNLRANTELLVTELNDALSITTIKNYVNPWNVNFEAYISAIDQTRNIITVHTERPFVEGFIDIYKGFTCTIEWNPQHFGDPSAFKQIREITIMFDQNNFYKAKAKFASDASAALNTVEFNGKGIGYWGDLPWGSANNYWGGEGNDIPFRNPVPRGKQKCRYLSLTFEHVNAREYFRILGISGVVRAISSRGYGTLG